MKVKKRGTNLFVIGAKNTGILNGHWIVKHIY